MRILNQRELPGFGPSEKLERRIHILTDFPDERLEAVVLQWSKLEPTVLIQLKKDPHEPLQFPGMRLQMPGNAELSKDKLLAVDLPLVDFVDASSGRPFDREAFLADILFSQRAFALVQPEPDLVMPAEALWECRQVAIQALHLEDRTGFGPKAEAETDD